MSELQERIEGQLVTRTFNVSGMPEKVWKEIDEFCRSYYGDVRWVMIKDLMEAKKIDWKFEMLYEELMALKEQVATGEKKGINVAQQPTVKPTFGAKVDKTVIGDRHE